ncbi:MAG: type II toxin-antitoxin system VapC family toxin [Verrucomicrobiota bacterium]|nr:type II toxin-antitoxin system VapC family toxin [Verrucomicrobiota bacterium]
MKVLLDTHIWSWWMLGDPRLSRKEVAILDKLAEEDTPHLSIISLWEIQVLHSKGRVSLSIPFNRWLLHASGENIVVIEPLTTEVILRLENLPANFHADPADLLITATALANGLPLMTHDEKIRKSRIVPIFNG